MIVPTVSDANSPEFREWGERETLKKRQLCFKQLARSLQKELDALQEEQLEHLQDSTITKQMKLLSL